MTSRNVTCTLFFLASLAGLPWSNHSPCVFLAALVYCLGFEYVYHRFFQHDPGSTFAMKHANHHRTYRDPEKCATTPCVDNLDFGGHPIFIVALFVGNGAPVLFVDFLFHTHWLASVMLVYVSFFWFLEWMHRRIHLGLWVPWGREHHLTHHHLPLSNYGVVSPVFDWLFKTKARIEE